MRTHGGCEEVVCDEYGFHYEWKIKGTKTIADCVLGDGEYNYERARRIVGWKSHHCRHQWEQRLIEREKHERNRLARARREGGELFPGE